MTGRLIAVVTIALADVILKPFRHIANGTVHSTHNAILCGSYSN